MKTKQAGRGLWWRNVLSWVGLLAAGIAVPAQADLLAGWAKTNSAMAPSDYLAQTNHAMLASAAVMNWKPRFYTYNDNSWFYLDPWCGTNRATIVAGVTNYVYTNTLLDGISATNQFGSTGSNLLPITNYFEFTFTVSNGYKISFTGMVHRMLNDEKMLKFDLRSDVDGYTHRMFEKTTRFASGVGTLITTNLQPSTNNAGAGGQGFGTYTNVISARLHDITNSTVKLRLYGTEANSRWVYAYWTNMVGTPVYSNYMIVFEGKIERKGNVTPGRGPYAGGNTVVMTNVAEGAIGDGGDITNLTVDGTAVPLPLLGQGTNWVRWTMPPASSAGAKDIVVQSASVGDTLFAGEYTYNPTGSIDSVSPASGLAAGGYPVTIAGANLCDGDVTNVTICGVAAASIDSQSATQVVVTAGAGAAGLGDVRIWSTSYGESVAADAFTYTNAGPQSTITFDSAGGSAVAPITQDEGTAVTRPADPTRAGYTFDGWVPDVPATMPEDDVTCVAQWQVLKTDQTIDFPPIGDKLTTDAVGLAATASSGLPVSFAVASGPATIASLTNLTFTGTGAVGIVASQAGDADWNPAPAITNTFNVTKAMATVFLQDLAQTYDGTARTVTATTMPAGLTVEITYDGSATAPVNAGAYAVTGTVDDVLYQGSVADSLVVARALDTIVFGDTNQTYNGAARIVTATADSGTSVALTYDGSATAPVDAGTYVVTGVVDAANWTATNTATLTVGKADQAVTFPAIGDKATTDEVGLSATVSSGLAVSFAVDSGPATIAGGTNLTFSGTGEVSIVASQAGDANWNAAPAKTNTFNVSKATATVFLQSVTQTYDGTARTVTATTMPAGLTVEFTYDGSASAPTNAGTYAVTGTVNDATYQGSAAGTLTIQKADQAISAFLPTNGSVFAKTDSAGLSATASSGLAVTFAVGSGPGTIAGGTNLTFGGTGEVGIVASQAGNANWNAAPSATNSYAVHKEAAQVYLQNLTQTYDGAARTVTATTMPAGLTVEFTYDGSATAPNNAGNYAVTGTVNDADYDGSAAGTLTIQKADQAIAFPAIADQLATNAVGLAATASSGLAVNFAVESGPGSIAGGTNLTFTGAGAVSIAASQAGNSNWNAAAFATNTFNVTKAPATVFLQDLAQTYDGTARTATATTMPAGLTVEFTYDGSATAPVNAGAYAVTGTVDDVLYQGSAADSLVVARAVDTIVFGDTNQIYDGTARIVTATADSGSSVALTYDGSATAPVDAGTYVVTGVVDAANWTATNTATLTVGKADQAITFPAIGDKVTTDEVGLSATASSGLAVSFAVDSGPATIAGGTNLTFSGAGSVTIVASQAGDANRNPAPEATNTFEVAKAPAMVYLLDLAQTYDGTARTISATTMPAGLTVEITYAGAASAPTNAGSYAVTGTVDSAMYQGSAAGTLVVGKASAAVTLGSLGHTYDGMPKSATATTEPEGLAVDFTYDGGATAPAAAGSYAVTGTVNDADFQGSATGLLVIGKAEATVFLLDLTQTYDGTARTASATTMPAGLTVEITYDGHVWAPTNAGGYAVTGTVDEANYRGSATGTLTVGRADQTIGFPAIGDKLTTDAVGLAATASSGLPVSFAVASGPAEITGLTNLTFTGAGAVSIVASQAGDADWNAATDATNAFNVAKATATVYLLDLAQTYDGTARTVTATTMPAGLTVEITYAGSGTAPTDAGTYAVTGTVNDTMYQGSAADTLEVGPAAATVFLLDLAQTYDGTARTIAATTMPAGLTVAFTYDGGASAPTNAGSYAVTGTVNDVNYRGSAAGTLTVARALDAIAFGDTNQIYDGTARIVTATAGSGSPVALTYAGNAWAPTNAGTYAVTGVVAAANWEATNTATLTVGKADQTIENFLPADGEMFDLFETAMVSATASSGLAVDFANLTPALATLVGTDITFIKPGLARVEASQAGAANWNPATLVHGWRVMNSQNALCDFDGDGKADLAVYHAAAGNWYIEESATGNRRVVQWGWPGGLPVPGDYDGDGRTDVAVYHPSSGNWFMACSTAGARYVQWGWPAAVPVPGDYDGDGATDVAVYDPILLNWHLRMSAAGDHTLQWGLSNSVPVPADYNGDGTTDLAVYQPATGIWSIRYRLVAKSRPSDRTVQWGWSEAVPVPGDYDGDGAADLAVYHRAAGNWYLLCSTDGIRIESWGWAGTAPVAADYDGDGAADVSVYHQPAGNWYELESGSGLSSGAIPFGWSAARPVLLQPLIHSWFGLP